MSPSSSASSRSLATASTDCWLTMASVLASNGLPMQAASVRARWVRGGSRWIFRVIRSMTLSVVAVPATASIRKVQKPRPRSSSSNPSCLSDFRNWSTKNGFPSVFRRTRAASGSTSDGSRLSASSIRSCTSGSRSGSRARRRSRAPVDSRAVSVRISRWLASTSLSR